MHTHTYRLLFPASCEYGISWDRVDGCANALIVLIALDSNRFLHCINVLVQQQEAYLQPLLLAAFEKLTSTGIYSFSIYICSDVYVYLFTYTSLNTSIFFS